MIKRPFIVKGYKAKKCLELVQTNVCGSFNVHPREGMSTSSPLQMITLSLDIFT